MGLSDWTEKSYWFLLRSRISSTVLGIIWFLFKEQFHLPLKNAFTGNRRGWSLCDHSYVFIQWNETNVPFKYQRHSTWFFGGDFLFIFFSSSYIQFFSHRIRTPSKLPPQHLKANKQTSRVTFVTRGIVCHQSRGFRQHDTCLKVQLHLACLLMAFFHCMVLAQLRSFWYQ